VPPTPKITALAFLDMKICFSLAAPAGGRRTAEEVCLPFPVAKGAIPAESVIPLIDASSDCVVEYSDVRCIDQWSDGTCRWLLVTAVIYVSEGTECAFYLDCGAHYQPCEDAIEDSVRLSESHVNSTTSGEQTKINLVPLLRSDFAIDVIGNNDECKRVEFARVNKLPSNAWFIDRLQYFANVELSVGKILILTVSMIHNRATLTSTIEVLLHNSYAAEHKNGLWDLGDSSSLNFKKIRIELVSADTVSYTHLTLPTSLCVCYSFGCVLCKERCTNRIDLDVSVNDATQNNCT